MKKLLLYLLLILSCQNPVWADQTITVGGALLPAAGGVPTGGTTGQALKKNSNADYDVSWGAVSGSFDTTATKIATVTTDTTVTTSNQTILCNAAAGTITITLPTASSACTADVCSVFDVKKIDNTSNACRVVVSGGSLIDGSTASVISAQYTSRTYQSNGSQYWHK